MKVVAFEAKFQSPVSRLKGEDKLVQRVIHKCWG